MNIIIYVKNTLNFIKKIIYNIMYNNEILNDKKNK